MNFSFEGLSVLFSQGMVVSPNEIIVEGSVGSLGGTNSDHREVKGVNWTSGYRGRNRRLLPGKIGMDDQVTCCRKSSHND